MTYTGSKAFVPPAGTAIAINTGTPSAPVWTPVSEVLGISPSGRKYAVEQTTNLNSTAVEKLKTLLDSGKIDIDYNYLGSDDAGEMAIEAAYIAPVPSQWQITIPGLPSGKTETISFSANLVEKDLEKIQRNQVMKGKLSLDLSGPYTFATA
jgi:hypothetical protein